MKRVPRISVKMAFNRSGRFGFILLLKIALLCLNQTLGEKYKIPDVTIQALSPKGFRASIPDVPNMGLFAFQGNVNQVVGQNGVGQLSGEVTQPTDGRWVYEDRDVQLKVGDVVHYNVFVAVNGAGYQKDNLKFTVTELGDRSAAGECLPTATRVRGGGTVCAGQTVFEDNFDTLRTDLWQLENFIPMENPEYPFVSYQSAVTTSVSGGNLIISPQLLQNLPGFNSDSIASGSINLLNDCTGTANECWAQAGGPSILPPVVSGRVTSNGFAFTYGTVHIRAKLPQGDWLYPEILLERFMKKYGSRDYASGVLKIASARGNKLLTAGVSEIGNKVLYGGPIVNFNCRDYYISEKKTTDGKMWGDEYHVYSVKWEPGGITLLVDNQQWARIEPATGGLRGQLPASCLNNIPLTSQEGLDPFDDFYYITLGVAAGGITEFRDGSTSGTHSKPWRNSERKAMYHFWNDLGSWQPSWTSPRLLVDYVKVVAL